MAHPTKRPPSKPSHRPIAKTGRSGAPQRREPQGAIRVRRGTVRVASDVAWRIRAGHPWLFRDALGNRTLREAAGDPVDVVDDAGGFVARGLFDPNGPIALRIFTREQSEVLDATSIMRRVVEAKRLRQRVVPPSLTAYRIIHGEGDGLPGITIDRFGDHLVSHVYTASVEPFLPAVYDAIEAEWKPLSIYEQKRYRPQAGDGPREPAALVRGSVAPVEIEVSEEGLRFAVDVTAPLGSGLFPDLREGRRAIRRLATSRRVLNLFSYTGAFSIHAAKGGASEVVSVDLAAKAHGRARHNLQLNEMSEQGHEFIAGDAMKVLARMVERGRRFDLVILDPPSFAQTRGAVFIAQKDYRDLVSAALGVLESGGVMACASNTAKLSLEEFDRIVGDGAHHAGRRLNVVKRCGLPPDFPVPAGFPEGHYLKFEVCIAS